MIKVFVKKSFRIANRGLIVELQHDRKGLSKGCILKSLLTQKEWSVSARVLFHHVEEKHILFENETLEWMLLKFDSIEKRNSSIQSISANELSGMFQYLLSPIGHDDKPEEEEILELEHQY